jgi:chromosome segregation ATPase
MEANEFSNAINEIEQDKQKLAFDIEKLVETAAQTKVVIAELQKKINDAQWALGEEIARREGLERVVQEKCLDLQRLGEEFKKLHQNYDESQWYLGEEQSKSGELRNALQVAQQSRQNLESQLEELKAHYAALQKELAEAKWYLGEERSKQQGT